jgi:hypothetical protein
MRNLIVLSFILSLSTTAFAQSEGEADFRATILKGWIQIGMVKINTSGDPYDKPMYVLSDKDGPHMFPISMRPMHKTGIEFTRGEWKELTQGGGQEEVTMRYLIDRPTPWRDSEPDTHRAKLTRNMDGSVKMVRTGKSPGLYLEVPILTKVDRDALISWKRDGMDPKIWDLSQMDKDASPVLSVFLPASVTDERVVTYTTTERQVLETKTGWIPNEICPGCIVYSWGTVPVGYKTVTDKHKTVKIVPKVKFDPFGSLDPKNVSKLCVPVQKATEEDAYVDRRLCVTFIPSNIQDFVAGCDSSQTK